MRINLCRECLKKQQRIDDLLEENQRLKQKLKYQERKEKEGFFGSDSSAKVPIKANTAKLEAGKRKGVSEGQRAVGLSGRSGSGRVRKPSAPVPRLAGC
jgi:cell shape-determining protein MreC